MNKTKKIVLSVILGVAVAAIGFYVALPAINIHDAGFWMFLTVVIAAFSAPFLFTKKYSRTSGASNRPGQAKVSGNRSLQNSIVRCLSMNCS